jgi:hypothetical protein
MPPDEDGTEYGWAIVIAGIVVSWIVAGGVNISRGWRRAIVVIAAIETQSDHSRQRGSTHNTGVRTH